MTEKLRGAFISADDLISALADYPPDEELYLCGDIYGGATLYDGENEVIWESE